MDQDFRLFPEQASSVAGEIDALYFFLLGVAAFFTLLIFLAIVFLALYYRRSATRDRSRTHSKTVWLLEATWIGVPLALTMIMFFWGAKLYFDMRTPPADALELQVVGKQWMWKIQHPQGRSEINELHVPLGRSVRLKMISEDVIHSFYVPAFRVKMDVLPGRYSSLWFEPTREGEYFLFCAEYCGAEHAKMSGRVRVVSQTDYVDWLASSDQAPPEAAGSQLFVRLRCHVCHDEGPDSRSPSLKNLYGSTRVLASGERAICDDAYLRESILDPQRKVSAGFPPLMPTYDNQLSEEQVLQLIDYIKSLKAAPADSIAS